MNRSEIRAKLTDEIRKTGSPQAMLEWELVHEIEERERLAYERGVTGWEPDPNEPEYDRDITKDRCRACGLLRGSVDVEIDFGKGPEPYTHFPDPCLGHLPDVGGACCGHGRSGAVVYLNRLSGPAAARMMRELGGNPPAAAFLLDPVLGAAQ